MPRCISLSEVGRRNIVYSDAQQIAIKNTLKTTEAGLLRLRTLRSIGPARRRQLKDQIRQCNVALAPFKKIPNEIWMYIFELYCQSGRLSTCDTRQSPVVITQVCSAWRQIALSMPKLWSDVHLHDNFNLARIWLGRAGNIPRALDTSRLSDEWFDRYNFSRHQTIQSLVRSLPFRKLHLTESDAEHINFPQIPVKSLLLLEDLALLKSALTSPYTGIIYLSPHHFPNLASLHIDMNDMPHFHVSRPFATWKKLRVLRLECILDKAKCLEILRDASSVEDCSLHLHWTPFHRTIQNAVVANLKIFRLSFPFNSELWPFLNHLTFPNLHTLILVSKSPSTFWPHDKSSLLHLAPRFGSLRSLSFHHSYLNVDVGLVLDCLPLLQVLELHCDKITTHTAEKIGRGELGRCLRELRDWNSINLFEFLHACELRRDVTQGQSPNSSGAIAGLEKVTVGHFESEAKCKWRIRKLCKDGVEFKVFLSSKVRLA